MSEIDFINNIIAFCILSIVVGGVLFGLGTVLYKELGYKIIIFLILVGIFNIIAGCVAWVIFFIKFISC